jgi:hypothetical protein
MRAFNAAERLNQEIKRRTRVTHRFGGFLAIERFDKKGFARSCRAS